MPIDDNYKVLLLLDGYIRNPHDKTPAWFVPQAILKRINLLKK